MRAWLRLLDLPGAAGREAFGFAGQVGQAGLLLWHALCGALRRPLRGKLLLLQIDFIGRRSLLLIALSAGFTGMVLVLQGYTALSRFGGEAYLGPLVALSLVRELGPVLGALMVSARAGSAMAAEIGSMRISEQIDALESMAVDPVKYLVAPRLLVALLAVPLLVAFFDVVGIGTAYLFGTLALGIDGGAFMASVSDAVTSRDVNIGLYKALAFAVVIVAVGTHFGYRCAGGARGIGQATTRTVVISAVLILGVDWLLTALLF